MGFFSGLASEGYDRQYSDRQLVSRITTYFRSYTWQLVVVTALMLVTAFATAATPVLVARGVDQLSQSMSGMAIGILSGAVFLAGVIYWVANWIRRRKVVRMIGDVVLALRTDAFEAAAAHDLSFYDEFASGKVVSRITSDTQDFGQTIVLVTDIFGQIIQSLILGIYLIVIDWRLSLLLFGFLPVLFLVALGFRRLARQVTRTGMRAMANVNATIKETVSGIAVANRYCLK